MSIGHYHVIVTQRDDDGNESPAPTTDGITVRPVCVWCQQPYDPRGDDVSDAWAGGQLCSATCTDAYWDHFEHDGDTGDDDDTDDGGPD